MLHYCTDRWGDSRVNLVDSSNVRRTLGELLRELSFVYVALLKRNPARQTICDGGLNGGLKTQFTAVASSGRRANSIRQAFVSIPLQVDNV